jgi:hypothetical protein
MPWREYIGPTRIRAIATVALTPILLPLNPDFVNHETLTFRPTSDLRSVVEPERLC